jgi:hypothetical protein
LVLVKLRARRLNLETRGSRQRSSAPARRDSRRNIIHDRLKPTTRKTERNGGRGAFVIAEMMAQHQEKKIGERVNGVVKAKHTHTQT